MKETRRLARPPLKLPSKTELHTQSPPVLSDMQGLKASKGMRDPVYFLIGSQFMNKARRIFLVKQSACHAGVRSLGQEDPLEEGMLPTPVFLPGEFHGQRSLVGYSPWGCKELDTTEAT